MTFKNRQRGHYFIPYNGKIADITHADTNKHTLDLETALSETRKIIAVILVAERIAGAGELYAYPNEGAGYCDLDLWGVYNQQNIIIKDASQRLQYSLSVANDDFDLYCRGYVVEV